MTTLVVLLKTIVKPTRESHFIETENEEDNAVNNTELLGFEPTSIVALDIDQLMEAYED